jgi:hypothetical protein
MELRFIPWLLVGLKCCKLKKGVRGKFLFKTGVFHQKVAKFVI